jgi:superfamily II DNA or RNA helicase
VIESHTPGFTSLLSSLSPDAHIRGKQFERVAKWWLTQDPIRSLDVKQAWLWDEWPERSGPDIGIDIVAEMFDGTLCAIQAKCFDENRDIPKSELDSFVSAASHRTFQHRWLIATTDRLSANARRMLDDQHVTRIMRSDLEESLDTWPTSIDELNPIQKVKSSPRPHQNLAINDVVKGLASSNRGQLIMACGTGKTLTALWIKETFKPKTTLVLVPSLNLLAQTLSEWAKNMSSPWNYLCVCSDDTVNKADDQPISTVGDLPFDVTTNSELIASFLQLGGEKIIFSTYQSSAQVAKAQEGLGTSFDLVICDEAHRLTGKTDADYATVLDEKKIVGQKRLFMTATPRTYTTAVKTKAEERGVEITSMDDEHIYGPVLHKLSFGEAIKQELLSDYRVLIVGVTDPQVQDLIDRRELISVNDAVTTDARTLAAHVGLAKATKDYNLKRTISFHSRIKTADQFARDHAKILEWLPESHKPSGETWTGTISGAMNTGDRRKLLTQLRLDGEDRHAILTNARCLTEGVDVPSLDGVAFIDPRSSQVDIIQAVGRAIRKSKDKEIGTIVLPVLIPTHVDPEDALNDTAFKPIWGVLNALKSHDEELAIELDSIRMGLGRTNSVIDIPTKIFLDLPIDIDVLHPNLHTSLIISLIERTSDVWFFWYGELTKFQETHGHSTPKKRSSPLGQWTITQRSRYRQGRLTAQRIKLLEDLGTWEWAPKENHIDTESKYRLIKSYVDTHGSLPEFRNRAIIEWDGVNIAELVTYIRSRKKIGTLSDEWCELFNDLNGWSWTPANELSWDRAVEHLRNFQEREGHSNVPQYHIEQGFKLGQWVANQRNAYRRGTIKTDRKNKLEEQPGWTWDRNDLAFDNIVKALRMYFEREGNYSIPHEHVEGGIAVGRAIRNLRSNYQYKRHRLDDQRIAQVEELPNWSWRPSDDRPDRAIRALEWFFTQDPRPPQSSTEFEGLKIPSALRQLSNAFKRNQLSPENRARLANLKANTGQPPWFHSN